MTAHRFRVKSDRDPSNWRDTVVGESRTLDEVQSAINTAFGLDEGHLWFFGEDENFWNSDVKYECPEEQDMPDTGGGLLGVDEEKHDASEKTVGDAVRRLGLGQNDRFCYLYDYGDEWRFYAVLVESLDDEPDEAEPEVVEGEGDEIDQYGTDAGFDPR